MRKIKVHFLFVVLKNFKLYGHFFWWGSTAPTLEPLRGGSLYFTTKIPQTPGIHFINLEKMKGWLNYAATKRLWAQDPWFENPVT